MFISHVIHNIIFKVPIAQQIQVNNLHAKIMDW